ncbi:MAG TPA: stage II sporulation protein M [Firmicutes bacterium]|nr:stage II sporulation protein M [Bacillota bacterium]
METKERLYFCLSQGFRMVFALLLFFFLLGIAFGYGAWQENRPQVTELMEMLVKNQAVPVLRGGGANRLVLAGWVFINNLQAGVAMVFLGGLFPFFPPFIISGNGMIIGMAAGYFEANKLITRNLFFLGLLPHGLFELAGLLFAAAMGVMWGAKNWLGWLRLRNSRGFFANTKDFISLVPLVIVLLLLAAIIEMFITPALFSSTM